VQPRLIHASLDPPESTYQTASRSVQPFLHSSRQKVPILYNGSPILAAPRNCPFAWAIWTPSNTWFRGPTRVHNPNGISIGSAGFAGLTIVTDRQTDRPTNRPRYSVCNNRPHLHCESKKQGTTILSITSPNVDRFSNFFH